MNNAHLGELDSVCGNCNHSFPAEAGGSIFGICLKDPEFHPYIDCLFADDFACCAKLIQRKRFLVDRKACADFAPVEVVVGEKEFSQKQTADIQDLVAKGQLSPENVRTAIATDIAIHVTAKDGRDLPLSYWDVWYALLAKHQFNGDLEQLARELRGMRKGCLYSEDAKRKLSHLRDFQQRLATAGVCLANVVTAIPPELAKAEVRRAHGRIIKHNQRSYELSDPMRILPEERLYEVALRGMWGAFPVAPAPYCEALRAKFNWRRCYDEDDSWGLAKKLDAETASAANLAKMGMFAEALATLRGAMTVTLELAQIADDSFGCIGMSFQIAFENYLALPRDKAGIASEAFLSDLLELLIFEDYGFTYGHTDGFFAKLSREEGNICLAYLRRRIPALMALDLDYQAEKSLTLIGQVVAEQKRFEQFEPLATEMEAREWQRIIRLVDAAVRARKRELADRVFVVALSHEGGNHYDFLSKKHTQLLHGKWNPDPRK